MKHNKQFLLTDLRWFLNFLVDRPTAELPNRYLVAYRPSGYLQSADGSPFDGHWADSIPKCYLSIFNLRTWKSSTTAFLFPNGDEIKYNDVLYVDAASLFLARMAFCLLHIDWPLQTLDRLLVV